MDRVGPVTVISTEEPKDWPVAWRKPDGKYCTAAVGAIGVPFFCAEEKDLFPHMTLSVSLSGIIVHEIPAHEAGTWSNASSTESPLAAIMVIGYVRGVTTAGTTVVVTVGGHTKSANLVRYLEGDVPVTAWAVRITSDEVPEAETLEWGPWTAQLHDASGVVLDETRYPQS